MRRGNVGDVETLHHPRQSRKLQRVAESLHIGQRIDRARQSSAGETPRLPGRFPDVIDHVSQLGRLFEFHFLGRFAHLLVECIDHFARLTLEKFTGLGGALAILLGRNFAQAHRHLVSRRFQFALGGRAATKRQHAKFLPHQIQSLSQRPRARVRSEVPRIVIFLEPRQPKTWPFFRHVDLDQ